MTEFFKALSIIVTTNWKVGLALFAGFVGTALMSEFDLKFLKLDNGLVAIGVTYMGLFGGFLAVIHGVETAFIWVSSAVSNRLNTKFEQEEHRVKGIENLKHLNSIEEVAVFWLYYKNVSRFRGYDWSHTISQLEKLHIIEREENISFHEYFYIFPIHIRGFLQERFPEKPPMQLSENPPWSDERPM